MHSTSASGKEPTWQYRGHKRPSSISGSGRSLEGGHGNPLQYSSLENYMDRGARRAMVHRLAENGTRLKRLSAAHTLHSALPLTCCVILPKFPQFSALFSLALIWISRSLYPWPSTQSRRPYIMVVKSLKASHMGLNTGFIVHCWMPRGQLFTLPTSWFPHLKNGNNNNSNCGEVPGSPVLRLCTPTVGSSGLIPGQGARSHIPLLRVHMLKLKYHRRSKIPWASTKTWHSQIKNIKILLLIIIIIVSYGIARIEWLNLP